MASATLSLLLLTLNTLSLLLLTLNIQLLLHLSPQTKAQTPSAPAPSPARPANLTAILDKNGQYTIFIGLLIETQQDTHIESQLNSSTEGMTVFAPTDNAFNNLKTGAINNLSPQQKVQLVQYHITPKYYSLSDLKTVSNPVPTQASDSDGVWGLNFSAKANQVNVSTGIVQTQNNNPLRQQFPLAVYQMDVVLLPEELFGAKAPGSAPSPAKTPPSTSSPTGKSTAAALPTSDNAGAGGRNAVEWGLALALVLVCMRALS